MKNKELLMAYLMVKKIDSKSNKMLDKLGIKSPTYHYYKLNKLLIENNLVNKRLKVSLLDCAWLKTLETFRKFGCNLKTLIAIHKELILDVKGEDIQKNNLEDKIEILKSKTYLSTEEEARKDSLKSMLDNDSLFKITSSDLSTFSQMVGHVINGRKSYIILYENNLVEPFYCQNIEQLINNSGIDLNKPHILIELGHILNELVNIDQIEKTIKTIHLLKEEID